LQARSHVLQPLNSNKDGEIPFLLIFFPKGSSEKRKGVSSSSFLVPSNWLKYMIGYFLISSVDDY
jgi:hypothetical protein